MDIAKFRAWFVKLVSQIWFTEPQGYIALFCAGVVLVAGGVYFFGSNAVPGVANCKVRFLQREVDGDSMYPFLKNGEKVTLLDDYFHACKQKPLTGDIIAYRYGWNIHPLIKVVRATHADTVEVAGGTLIINGAPMTNSVGDGYLFTPGELAMLKLYIRDGRIPPDSYLLFGDNVRISVDSRKFGAVSLDDFIGKFIR